MQSIRKKILPDVFLTHYPATKFKNSLLSIQLVFPLDAAFASANALFPAVLRRGTARYTDMRSISSALDALYGASIAYTVRKKGENQCVGFVGSFIDDAFTLGGERLLEPVAKLMGEILLDPVVREGCFLSEYAAGEKENLADAIRSVINDKREYADMRLLQEMCKGERYAVDRLGDEESLSRLDARTLYAHYQKAIASARVEVFYCGSADISRVEDALEAGAEDFNLETDIFVIDTDPNELGAVRDGLEAKGYTFLTAQVQYVPQTYTTLENPEDIEKMEKLIDMLEDCDDVQNI